MEPIFGSEDILQQMPNEGRKFRAVDATWRRVMAAVRKAPEVLLMCSDDELLKNLIEANKFLEQVQSRVNQTHASSSQAKTQSLVLHMRHWQLPCKCCTSLLYKCCMLSTTYCFVGVTFCMKWICGMQQNNRQCTLSLSVLIPTLTAVFFCDIRSRRD